MGFLMIILLSFCYISLSPKASNAATFDVTSYGAKGDGNTDDSKAFIKAWADLCGDSSSDATLVIPAGRTFLVGPVSFNGSSCKSSRVNIKLLGKITAPRTLDGWRDCQQRRFWLYFTSVRGLVINGPGQIDGQGSLWWGKQAKTDSCDRPTALRFNNCNGLRLSGTTHINSPFLHISIGNCIDVDIGNIHIIAPRDSPNTDGIDVSASSHINIHDTNIQTGDDCVAINGGVVDMNVTRVFCGPGHGISIGSLGENGRQDTVEQVLIQNCNITGTTNGLRIKTVPGGTGYAKGITFQNINLVNVQNPILIDQHYCSNSDLARCPSKPGQAAVKVSNVKFINIHGSSATKSAITFSCSQTYNCTDIVTKDVGITGNNVVAICENTQGNFINTTPNIHCN